MRVRGAGAAGALIALVWGIHAALTARHGFALPDALREAWGASARTVFSRAYALFTAPFLHESLGHVAYNSVLFAIGTPFAVRAFGLPAVGVAYLASPLAGFLVDVLLILPLAALGLPSAVAAAPERLVGASVVAWAAIGMALAAHAPQLGWIAWAAAAAVVAYEAALAFAGVTQGFVWAYHLTGFGLGAAAARLLPRLL